MPETSIWRLLSLMWELHFPSHSLKLKEEIGLTKLQRWCRGEEEGGGGSISRGIKTKKLIWSRCCCVFEVLLYWEAWPGKKKKKLEVDRGGGGGGGGDMYVEEETGLMMSRGTYLRSTVSFWASSSQLRRRVLNSDAGPVCALRGRYRWRCSYQYALSEPDRGPIRLIDDFRCPCPPLSSPRSPID